LDLDDGLGAFQLRLQTIDPPTESGVLFGEWIDLRTPFPGGQSLEYTFGSLKTPLGQVRRIEPLPAKQGPYLARSGAVVGLLKDAQLVLGGKPASLWLDLDLGIHSGE
jgi:hypothetical protein